jgi:hypothetical protein
VLQQELRQQHADFLVVVDDQNMGLRAHGCEYLAVGRALKAGNCNRVLHGRLRTQAFANLRDGRNTADTGTIELARIEARRLHPQLRNPGRK